MSLKRFGVRAKFIVLIGLLLSTVFASMTFYLARRDTDVLRRNLYDEAKSFSTLATDPIGAIFVLYKDSGTINIDSAIKTYTKLNKNITNVAFLDLNGNIVYSQHSTATKTYPEQLSQSFEPIYINNSKGALETIIYPYKEPSGVRRYGVVYTISSEAIDKSVTKSLITTVVFSTFWLVITLLLVYVTVNYLMIRNIRKISSQSQLISEGNFSHSISLESNDEFGDLAHSVNVMAESLKNNIEKLKELDKAKSEFMMITSHNLRTPLAIIDSYIESTAYFKSIEEYKSALKEIAHGSKRLNIFAEDVLTISQLELGEKLQSPTQINIQKFVNTLCQDFSELAQLKGVDFETDLHAQDVSIQISKPYIRAAIWNILDNALKFTEKTGKISLRLEKSEDRVSIQISDTGIGISPQEISKLFTKFHRSTDTATYNYEGTGIGLYATKMIVERHNGTVSVQSEEGKGSSFTIMLPIAEIPRESLTTTV